MIPACFIESKFPAYYKSLPCACPHPQAVEQDIDAYRFCENKKVSSSDFMSYYEIGRHGDKNDSSYYSVSLCANLNTVRKLSIMPNFKEMFIAKGKITGEYGPSRINNRNTHIDWWLYENSRPWYKFSVIDWSAI